MMLFRNEAASKDLVNIALPKGRLEFPSRQFLAEVGLAREDADWPDRALVQHDPILGVRYLLVRPSDVVTYVSEGAADVGIVGKDVIMEADLSVYEVLDLGFGECRLGVAAPSRVSADYPCPEDFYRSRGDMLRVATKYPNIAERHFSHLGLPVRAIPLRGSVELAPMVGLADVIVDLVSTGKTLETNEMVLLEEVARITARLIVNPVSMKVRPRITNLLGDIRSQKKSEGGGARA